MNFQIIRPNGLMAKFIKHYCFMESGNHNEDVMERVIPAENVQLMFHYRSPFVVFHRNNTLVKQPRSILCGLNNSFSDVSTDGETGVVFIIFHTAGACNFFPFPLSEIENRSVDLADIFDTEIRQIEEMLFLAGSNEERVSIIERFLMKRFSPIPLSDSMLVRKGVEIIKRSQGQTNAVSLSDSLTTTTKTLERKFSHYLGKSTKQIIMLMRFQVVLRDLGNHKSLSLTERAYRNGYYDQSHFIRDFKTYSGYTPGEFLARYPHYNPNAEA